MHNLARDYERWSYVERVALAVAAAIGAAVVVAMVLSYVVPLHFP
jgi:hypothetical protein